MAQKRRQTATGMDSVFDFIFAESKKTPDKVKPVKVTGLDSTDPYVDVATAVLEQPLMYVNKTTEDAIKDVWNIPIHEFNIDSRDGKVGVKLSTGNIRDVLNNDLTFVDKTFDRMEASRKAGRMTAWGRDIAAFTAAGMATQMGLDSDTRDLLLKIGKAGQDPNADFDMGMRSVNIANKLWEGSKFQDLSLDDLKSRYGDSKGTETYNKLQEMHRLYKAELSKPEEERNMRDVFSYAADKDMRLFFENANLRSKATALRSAATKLDPNSKAAKELNRQASGYESTRNVLGALEAGGKYEKHGAVERYIKKQGDRLKDLKDELKNLEGKTDDTSKARVEKIGEDIKNIDIQVRNFKIQKAAYDLGVIETQINSVKQLYEYTVGGALIPAIINGDFFDERKNVIKAIQPRDSSSKFEQVSFDKDGKEIVTEFKGILAKKGNRFQQAYYEGMMDIYYNFTPKGIVENLTTGKGFARQAYKQQEMLKLGFENSEFAKLFAEGDIDWRRLFSSEGKAYLDGLAGDSKYVKFLEYMQANGKKFEKFGRLAKRAQQFNMVDKGKQWLSERFGAIYSKTFGKLTGAIKGKVQGVLLKLAKDKLTEGVIKDWFAKEGLKGVSIAIKATIKSALASATGGVGATLGFVVDMAVDLAMQVAVKLARPVVKTLILGGVFALVGIIGMGYLILVAPFKTMKTLGQYSHVAPHEIVMGDPDYTVPQGGNGIGEPGEWEGGPPLPDGVSCLLGADGSYRCTQGPGGGFSHRTLNAIDVGYGGIFYAPTFCGKGNCFIEYYGDFSCTAIGAGNAITLTAEYGGNTYKFIMYHVTLSSELSMGSQVSAGQAVGQILIGGTVSDCWTGPHLHLEIEYNGSRVNPYDVMTGSPDSGGFGCNITPCP